LIANFHQQLPETLYNEWVDFEENELKTDLAIRLISHKSHGLNASQIQKLGAYLAEKLGPQDKLVNYLSNPDLRSVESIKSLLTWLNLGEEMTSNPYYTPIILSAAISTQDPLAKYEILNSATEFNQDPILWIEKVKAARVMGLDNYASEALIQMQGWLSQEEISKLEIRNY